jgi:hypothetical protein
MTNFHMPAVKIVRAGTKFGLERAHFTENMQQWWGIVSPGVPEHSTMVFNNGNDVAHVGGASGTLKPQGSQSFAPRENKNVL